MFYNQLQEILSEEEIATVEYLESIGYVVMTEVRIEDGKQKDGARVRTFKNQGRYDLVIGMKKFAQRANDIEFEKKIAEKIADNFWMIISNWKRKQRDVFYNMVTVEHMADLKKAPVDLQEEVKKKFIKYFDENDWPIK